jgi:hypothetical protein
VLAFAAERLRPRCGTELPISAPPWLGTPRPNDRVRHSVALECRRSRTALSWPFLIAEYAGRCGHLDLIRVPMDGQMGD